MAGLPDLFHPHDVIRLLLGKVVVLLGDSNMRATYKDLVTLTQRRSFVANHDLKTKMEKSYLGDHLLYHGELCNGRDFREERKFNSRETKGSYHFFFITKAHNDYVAEVLHLLKDLAPDVVLINSCLWDITRWGPSGVEQFKKNLRVVMKKLKEYLRQDCLIIWLTTAPITTHVHGGFLVQQLEFLRYSLRFHVMEANQYAHNVSKDVGFDVLDIHYNLRMLLHLRAEDGIHWQPPAVRHITNSILTHISLAWDVPLPHRFPSQTNAEGTAVATVPKAPLLPTPRKRKRKSRKARSGKAYRYCPHNRFPPTNARQEAMRNALFGNDNFPGHYDHCNRAQEPQFTFDTRGTQFFPGPINQLAFLPNFNLTGSDMEYSNRQRLPSNPYNHFLPLKQNNSPWGYY